MSKAYLMILRVIALIVVFVLGMLTAVAGIVGAGVFASTGITLDKLEQLGISIDTSELFDENNANTSLRSLSILDMIKEINEIVAISDSASLDYLTEDYGLILPPKGELALLDALRVLPFSVLFSQDGLIEATDNIYFGELFGYERGAFTSADPKGKPGMFELANGGTILLDEIAELPLSFQAKLLRVLQNKQIIRLGGTKTINLNLRIIVSTNRNLRDMVSDGSFREDLYYRVNVLPLNIPPLRHRPEDIDALTRYYLKKFNAKYGKQIIIEPLVYYNMKRYRWSGNVRELENIVERWVVIFDAYAVIRWEQVRYTFDGFQDSGESDNQNSSFRMRTMSEIVDDCQRDVLMWARAEYGSVRDMAEALGMDHSTIVKKAKKLGVSLDRPGKNSDSE